jgi:Leucine-rich repeat (LRR) protein
MLININNTNYSYLSSKILDESKNDIIKVGIYHSKLNEIPKEIYNLIKLYDFSFCTNKLDKLPLELCNLTNLHFLNCASNKITELPSKLRNHELYDDGQNVHTSSIQESVKKSIIILLNDIY